jgi:hypothetical protein
VGLFIVIYLFILFILRGYHVKKSSPAVSSARWGRCARVSSAAATACCNSSSTSRCPLLVLAEYTSAETDDDATDDATDDPATDDERVPLRRLSWRAEADDRRDKARAVPTASMAKPPSSSSSSSPPPVLPVCSFSQTHEFLVLLFQRERGLDAVHLIGAKASKGRLGENRRWRHELVSLPARAAVWAISLRGLFLPQPTLAED